MAKLTVPIIVNGLEEAKKHSMDFYDMGYKHGTSDTVDKAIDLLKEYPLVKAMGEILKLKEQKNE